MKYKKIFCFATILIIASFVVPASYDLECRPYVQKDAKETSYVWDVIEKASIVDGKIPREEIKFFLFTRENQDCFQEINATVLKDSMFNPRWPVRIIIHGWLNDGFSRFNRLLKDAYLTKGDFNVVVVDWGGLAYDVIYDRASKLVDEIGGFVAEFAALLNSEMRVSYDNMYLIGHSLGAQIAGVAGNLAIKKFNTIFALDPAGRNFESSENDSRINKESAKYVESIHTNMGYLGVKYPVGHASFFPNYGRVQEGCVLKHCSHSRAYRYFVESINSNKGFWGRPCNSMEEITKKRCSDTKIRHIMGGEPSTPKSGYFYLSTNKKEPFAKGNNLTLPFWSRLLKGQIWFSF